MFKCDSLNIASIILISLLILPFLILFKTAFSVSDFVAWQEVSGYLTNSLLLAFLVLFLGITIGVSLAWLVSYYEFPGVSFFRIALIFPFAIPSYIMAIIYAYIIEEQVPYFFKNFGIDFFPEIRNIYGAALMLAFSLFPYVYLLVRSSFSKITDQIMIASLCGKSNFQIFRKVAIPAMLPAIISGGLLLLMEVFADFGVVSFYGVESFVTAIYSNWFYLENYNGAAFLSLLLLVTIICIMAGVKFLKRKARYQVTSHVKAVTPILLTGKKSFAAIAICTIILLFTFIIPVAQILAFTFDNYLVLIDRYFLRSFTNSVTIAIIATLVIIVVAILLVYSSYHSRSLLKKAIINFVSLGYALPGSVIAVAILYGFNLLIQQLSMESSFLLGTSIIGLIYAYNIRFMTLAYKNINIAFKKVPDEFLSVGSIYQHNNYDRIKNIYAPFMMPSIITASLFVAVDIIKELPATLIIRPFNFDTLATRTYELASDEMVAESAVSSLAIILVNIIPIYFLTKFLIKNDR